MAHVCVYVGVKLFLCVNMEWVVLLAEYGNTRNVEKMVEIRNENCKSLNGK